MSGRGEFTFSGFGIFPRALKRTQYREYCLFSKMLKGEVFYFFIGEKGKGGKIGVNRRV